MAATGKQPLNIWHLGQNSSSTNVCFGGATNYSIIGSAENIWLYVQKGLGRATFLALLSNNKVIFFFSSSWINFYKPHMRCYWTSSLSATPTCFHVLSSWQTAAGCRSAGPSGSGRRRNTGPCCSAAVRLGLRAWHRGRFCDPPPAQGLTSRSHLEIKGYHRMTFVNKGTNGWTSQRRSCKSTRLFYYTIWMQHRAHYSVIRQWLSEEQ